MTETPITDSLIESGKLATGEAARAMSLMEKEAKDMPDVRRQCAELATKLNRANSDNARLKDENNRLVAKIETMNAFALVMIEEAREAME